jgi:hypothetical protein
MALLERQFLIPAKGWGIRKGELIPEEWHTPPVAEHSGSIIAKKRAIMVRHDLTVGRQVSPHLYPDLLSGAATAMCSGL